MKVIFVSECSKKALKNTRRILDQFSIRKGRRVWITDITQEGLDTVHDLLQRSARKNTSIICYRIFGHSIDILFFVGNTKMFNEFGDVATNLTSKNIAQKYADEKISSLSDTIALLAKLAGLFHDFGKASPLFQMKLTNDTANDDQIRHEYISALFLYASGKGKSDLDFLDCLMDVERSQKKLFFCENHNGQDTNENNIAINDGIILSELPPVARLATLLCLTHHKLPVYKSDTKDDTIKLERCRQLNDSTCLKQHMWGYSLKDKIQNKTPIDIRDNSLYNSNVFINALTDTVNEIKQKITLIETHINENTEIVFHFSRFCLMLADHVYSSKTSKDKNHDPYFQLIANTIKGKANQYLDNHSFYVSKYAYNFALSIMKLRYSLPQLHQHKILSLKAKDKFAWQNEAYKKSEAISQDANKYGFFGVNSASTGTGKTLCNAKIMDALNTNTNCRFSYAIPLRTLTLQTGKALKEKLKLNTSEIGIKIGSATMQELYEIYDNKNDFEFLEQIKINDLEGSESADISDDSITVLGDITDDTYINNPPKEIRNILQGKFKDSYKTFIAPILACTIDTMMSASEGIKGGRQLIGMLRLLSADLILDETDELSLQDQNAACRLAFFAGLCGTKLLLSSASMQPYLIRSMFLHYRKGRCLYNRALGIEDNNKICVGFFGEFFSDTTLMDNDDFDRFYKNSVDKHIGGLIGNKRLYQRAKFINIESDGEEDTSVKAMAKQIISSILELSSSHFTPNKNICVSTGLVRFANINTLIKVAKSLLAEDAPEDTCIHYCIYHSQYTIAQRAHIEKTIDSITNRKDDFFGKQEIIEEISKLPKAIKHIFVTISSPVSEIGRDNDYDFAIVEPSSFRSIIQVAGRVQRHRNNPVEKHNIHILNQNFKALVHRNMPYSKPGYESEGNELTDKMINHGLDADNIDPVNSAQLIGTEIGDSNNLITIEKIASKQYLESHYCTFLENDSMHYFGMAQTFFRFRGSGTEINIRGFASKNGKHCDFKLYEDGYWKVYKLNKDESSVTIGNNILLFGNISIDEACALINEAELNQDIPSNLVINNKYNEVNLYTYNNELTKLHEQWVYSDIFGFYRK